MNQFLRKTLSICSLIILFFASKAQDISGTWQGTLDVQGNQIPIVFHIKKDSTNKWKAAFDSPSQQAFDLPCSDVIVKEDSIILIMAIINGKYAGSLNTDHSQMTGRWFQGPGSLPLSVKKTSDMATVTEEKRPQTPILQNI